MKGKDVDLPFPCVSLSAHVFSLISSAAFLQPAVCAFSEDRTRFLAYVYNITSKQNIKRYVLWYHQRQYFWPLWVCAFQTADMASCLELLVAFSSLSVSDILFPHMKSHQSCSSSHASTPLKVFPMYTALSSPMCQGSLKIPAWNIKKNTVVCSCFMRRVTYQKNHRFQRNKQCMVLTEYVSNV